MLRFRLVNTVRPRLIIVCDAFPHDSERLVLVPYGSCALWVTHYSGDNYGRMLNTSPVYHTLIRQMVHTPRGTSSPSSSYAIIYFA